MTAAASTQCSECKGFFQDCSRDVIRVWRWILDLIVMIVS